MLTLAIEASNKSLSIALFKGDDVLIQDGMENTLQHSIHLATTVDRVMKQSPYTYQQLDRIVVSNGPGSYTGLRIGVTFAKTLAQTVGCSLIGVSSLKVLALSAKEEALVIPFYDARRQNVFVGYYENGQSVKPDEHIAFSEVLNNLSTDKPLCFISPDMAMYQPMILEKYPNAVCVTTYPKASNMLQQLMEQEQSVHDLLPSYLKLAEAEENWRKENPFVATNDLIERRNDK